MNAPTSSKVTSGGWRIDWVVDAMSGDVTFRRWVDIVCAAKGACVCASWSAPKLNARQGGRRADDAERGGGGRRAWREPAAGRKERVSACAGPVVGGAVSRVDGEAEAWGLLCMHRGRGRMSGTCYSGAWGVRLCRAESDDVGARKLQDPLALSDRKEFASRH